MNTIAAAIRRIAREAWSLFTLAYPKPEDAEAGVDLTGQGRWA